MRDRLFWVLLIVIVVSFIGCTPDGPPIDEEKRPVVAVSVVPQATFVKAVAGELVEVVTMIPPGNSPTNYQPTPKEMMAFSEADIYFGIGVGAEQANIMPRIKDLNSNAKVIHLDEVVGNVYPHRYFDEEDDHGDEEDDHGDEEDDHGHEQGAKDPHIWLSPKRVKVMIEVIKDELVQLDPEHKDIYETNASKYIQELDTVDEQIKSTLKGVKQQSFIVYHPSFGYFAEDYDLKMVSVEQSGKQATAKGLEGLINFAKENNIKVIFYQEEFDSTQAETLAQEISGEAIKVEALAPNYIENLQKVADTFKEVLE